MQSAPALCCLNDNYILLVLSRRREDKLQQNILYANSHFRGLVHIMWESEQQCSINCTF